MSSGAINLNNQVAIVTGAGRGLGREFALALAQRGAKVVVNGRGTDNGKHEQAVVEEIIEQGGKAMAINASVTDYAAVSDMVVQVLEQWGRVDVLVNNAGELRDKSFIKTSMDDFNAVIQSHLIGSSNCTHAVWPQMLKQGYGRIIMITSSSGLAGNFGQAAYSAAKMGLVGLMNTLGLEGERKDVYVNCLSPIGLTENNKAVIPSDMHEFFRADKVVPALIHLASEQAPNRAIILGGGGSFERVHISMTLGHKASSAEDFFQRFDDISNRDNEILLHDASDQAKVEIETGGFQSVAINDKQD